MPQAEAKGRAEEAGHFQEGAILTQLGQPFVGAWQAAHGGRGVQQAHKVIRGRSAGAGGVDVTLEMPQPSGFAQRARLANHGAERLQTLDEELRHDLVLLDLLNIRQKRIVITRLGGASQRHGLHFVLRCLEQQFRCGPEEAMVALHTAITPEVVGGMEHMMQQRSGRACLQMPALREHRHHLLQAIRQHLTTNATESHLEALGRRLFPQHAQARWFAHGCGKIRRCGLFDQSARCQPGQLAGQIEIVAVKRRRGRLLCRCLKRPQTKPGLSSGQSEEGNVGHA